MKHDCRLRSLEVFEDEDGYLYVKDQCHMPFGKDHTFRVEYCPVCGQKGNRSHIAHMTMFNRTDIPDSPHPIIPDYHTEMVKVINDLNKNIEVIKAFMISQSTQNECFMDRDFRTSEKMSELTRRLQSLEELNDHKIPY